MLLTTDIMHNSLTSIHTLCGTCTPFTGVLWMYIKLGVLVYPPIVEPLRLCCR